MTKIVHEYLVDNEKEMLTRRILDTVNEMVDKDCSKMEIQMFLYETWNNIYEGMN